MARVAILVICLTTTIAGVARADSFLKFGMSMAVTAFDSVCCDAASYIPQDPGADTEKAYFGRNFLKQGIFGRLPDQGKDFKSKCEKYLDPNGVEADPPADEGDALNDGGNKKYPYRAFSYCMIKALRDKRGNGAIDAVKAERTHSHRHWRTSILERENQFRALHGVEPLRMMKDLNDAAQKWAEADAKMCDMKHSDGSIPDRQWMGGKTGENLAASGGKDDAESQAYQSANGWYEEIKDYPFPKGIRGMQDAEIFHKVGHFTQSVWKNTTMVGYGYAYNPKCSGFKRYLAARYSPGGNVDEEYQENVLPPKK